MKNLRLKLNRTLCRMLFVSLVLLTISENMYSAEDDFLLTIQNIVQPLPDQLEFDIYLQDTDSNQPFELSFIQMGIGFNLEMLSGLSASPLMTTILPGCSELPVNMQPTDILTTSLGQIKVWGRNLPGAGNGCIISTVFPGTRIARLRITNGSSYTVGASPDFTFTSSSSWAPVFPTKIAIYSGGITNTNLEVISEVNAIVLSNPVLSVPTILNSMSGMLEGSFNQATPQVLEYIVTAMNLTDNLVITSSTSMSDPEGGNVVISTDTAGNYTDTIILSPVNGIIETSVYVKSGINLFPFDCTGRILHNSPGADTDSVNVHISCLPGLSLAPVVSLGQLQERPGSVIRVPLTAQNFGNIARISFTIEYNPEVLSFTGLENIKAELPTEMCTGCSDPDVCCNPGTYFLVNESSADSTLSAVYIEIARESGQFELPDCKLFDLVFDYSDGVSAIEFTDGAYCYNNTEGFQWIVINEPFDDYYFDGSVSPLPDKSILLEVNLEGLYDPVNDFMNKAVGPDFPATIADLITFSLALNTFPYTIELEIDSVSVDQNGTCLIDLPDLLSGEYYIVISHRNSIETWSATPISFDGSDIAYDFTTSANSAFGSNMKLMGEKYCLFGGDVNQDGAVDTGDMSPVDNDAAAYAEGYLPSDVNGDGIVDTADMIIIDNNTSSFTGAYFPIATIPVVSTIAVTGITGSSANCGGEITSDGGSSVSVRGVCWDTAPNPTPGFSHTLDGSGTGTFYSILSALSPSTTYYVRAYATNGMGTGFGNEVSFTTRIFDQGSGLTDYDNNEYSTAILGNREWMTENLKVTHYMNGDTIPNITDNSWNTLTSGAFCWYNHDETSFGNEYGALYNWYTVTDSRKLCPQGWRVPNEEDWTILANLLGGTENAGGKMKSLRTVPDAHPRWDLPNTGATNASDFSGFPGGYRLPGGTFEEMGRSGYWWNTSPDSLNRVWMRALDYNSDDLFLDIAFRQFGFSVRCVRGVDTPSVTTSPITNLTEIGAISGGDISNDGGEPVIQRGVCWGTAPNPEIDGPHSSDGSGTGQFIGQILGLYPSTTYYTRAYAVNINGISYGNQVSFTTPASVFICGAAMTVEHLAGSVAPVNKTVIYQTLETDLSGNTKCWIAQNLGADHQASTYNDNTEASAGWYW